MSAGKWPRHISSSGNPQAKEAPLRGLPPRPYPLIGRQNDLETAQDLILRGHVRLVTITGPPGVGKTRFAIELASSVVSEFDEGAVFVDLTPVRDPALVLDTVAHALGVLDHPDRPPLQRLQGNLGDRNVLLLLDNFEQIITAAADVAELLTNCPDIKMLVTSRQPLHVRWEHRYNLLPLAVPEARTPLDAAVLGRSPAIGLFIERAHAAEKRFSVDERNAPIVAEICRRLDGLQETAHELGMRFEGRAQPTVRSIL